MLSSPTGTGRARVLAAAAAFAVLASAPTHAGTASEVNGLAIKGRDPVAYGHITKADANWRPRYIT